MTIKIEIEAHPERGDMGQQVERAMAALGYARSVSSVSREALINAMRNGPSGGPNENPHGNNPHIDETAETQEVETTVELDMRMIGQSAEGKSRRNSAQKAEDDELEALAAAKGVAPEKLDAAIVSVGRAEARRQLEAFDAADKQIADEPQAAISTGEERISPDDAQDAADEAAETEKTGLAPIDVLRRLLGDYQKKHGMPAAVKLCQDGGLIGAPINDLDDAGIEAAIAAMRNDPDPAGNPAPAEPEAKVEPKTKADLIEAMMQYADKFDGTREQAEMKATLEDCPKIFIDVFGPDVQKLSQVPEDGYARAVAAIQQAIETDPYGRAK